MKFDDNSILMGDFRTHRCAILPLETGVETVIKAIQKHPDQYVGLVEKGRLEGIITPDSIISNLSAETLTVKKREAIEFASTRLAFVAHNASLSEFLNDLQDGDYDHIVVTDAHGSIRVVQQESQSKIFEFKNRSIRDVVKNMSGVQTLDANASCVRGLDILSHEDTPHAIITEGNVPAGIITRKDITKAIERHANLWALNIIEVAERDFLLAQPTAPAAETIFRMKTDKIHHLICPLGEEAFSIVELSKFAKAIASQLNPLITEIEIHQDNQQIQHMLGDHLIEKTIGDSMHIGVIALSPNLEIQYTNNTSLNLLESSREVIYNTSPDELPERIPMFAKVFEAIPALDPQKNPHTDIQTDDDLSAHYQIRVAGIWKNNVPDGYIITLQDYTDVRLAETKLRKLAYYDALTGLPNRSLLFERLSMEIKLCKRNRNGFAVVFVDLDGFKAINDQYGHRVGDIILCEAGSRFTKALRDSDTVARLGGDEFVFLLPGVRSEKTVNVAIYKVLDTLKAPFHIEGKTLSLSASFGTAFYPKNGSKAETLLEHADHRMYSFKRKTGIQ